MDAKDVIFNLASNVSFSVEKLKESLSYV